MTPIPIRILLIFFAAVPFFIYAQSPLSGNVKDDTGQPLLGATLQLQGTRYGVISDENGYFEFKTTPFGNFKLLVSSLGFRPKSIEVQLKRNNPVILTINLSEANQELDEVVVLGKSEAQRKREEPIKVEVIDVAQILEQATSIPEIINQSSGVKVRQSSGVGSSVTININGLQGNAVRYFKDGIPTDYLGRSFNIGLVPTSIIKNVEIYKGVLPIDLGADALGGAINIVTSGKNREFLDASYEIGSFNSHTVNLNTNYIVPNTKVHVGVSSYVTYSDNDYEFDLDINTDGNVERFRVRRFHDAFRARYVEASAGVHQTSWADLLDVKLSYFDMDNEVQNGISITQPFGEVKQGEITRLASLQYIKNILPNWNANLFGALSRTDNREQDLAEFTYNWFGEQVGATQKGEVQLRDQRIEEDTKVARFATQYDFNERFNLKLSSTHNRIDRVGSDPFAQENLGTGIQPITIPSYYSKAITGLGLGSKFFGDKLQGETFVKNYYLETESANFFGDNPIEQLFDRSFGYGQSFKFDFDETSYARVSFERATRIPEADEYFGDNLFLLPNPELVPETSDNVNIGFATNLNASNSMYLEINGFYRDTENFIRIFPLGIINSININSDTQITQGIETNFRINPDETSSVRLAVTYQDLRRKDTSGSDRVLEDSRTPNIPYFFTNLSASKRFENPFNSKLDFNVYGNYLFTEQFFVRATSKELEPPLFGEAPSSVTSIIPTQHQVNLGLTCILKKIPLSLNFEAINVLDNELFDELRIPRPLRNYRFKMTYRL